MTKELAQKRVDYWMKKFGLYEFAEAVEKSQTHKPLNRALKAAGYIVPKIPLTAFKHSYLVRYVSTPDDWYPNYRDNKVRASWDRKTGYICVSGADDYCLISSRRFCKESFELLCDNPGGITKEFCSKLGFVPGG